MVAALVVLTILICILLDWIVRRTEYQDIGDEEDVTFEAQSSRLSPPIHVAGLEIQTDLAYHPGHAWAIEIGPGKFRVGVDDFARRLVGNIDRVDLPSIGEKVTQGKTAWVLHHGNMRAPILAPVTGEVVAINPRVRVSARMISSSP